ncbi:MAG TPA: polyprenyl synthetase family protein [Candidatus Saccharimonadales bacterium]
MGKIDFRTQVEDGLKELFSTEQKAALTGESRELIKLCAKVIIGSGKRFRPRLFDVTYAIYGGKDSRDVLDMGLALELFHQALLVHDDVIDQDLTRNGQLNIIGEYKKDKDYDHGNTPEAMAILAGDYLLNLVNKIIIDSKQLTNDQKIVVIRLFIETFNSVIFGQQLDSLNIDNLMSDITASDLMNINIKKTASYTTILPMRLAAYIRKLEVPELAKIDKFAQDLGLYYQLVNDYSDYFSLSTEDVSPGKLSDYKVGKITYIYKIAKDKLKGKDLSFFTTNFSNSELTSSDMNKISILLKKYSIDEFAKDEASAFLTKASDELEALAISKDSKLQLTALLENLKI